VGFCSPARVLGVLAHLLLQGRLDAAGLCLQVARETEQLLTGDAFFCGGVGRGLVHCGVLGLGILPGGGFLEHLSVLAHREGVPRGDPDMFWELDLVCVELDER
jgi:hypothetical protein